MANPTSKLNLVINGTTTQLDIHDANAVPRSGGAVITGTNFCKTTTDSRWAICGGTNSSTGANIYVCGKDYTNPSRITLQAFDGVDNTIININPDGSCTYQHNLTLKNLAMQEDTIPRSGGAVMTSTILARSVDTSEFVLVGGTGWDHGGSVGARGKNANTWGGFVVFTAHNGTSFKQMFLQPNGTWTWTGTACQITSDQRLKQQINTIDDKLLDAWQDVELCQFKYNDAVDQKGDNARLHTGYVVQQIDEACKSHNLDISEYGLYCHEEYPERTEEVEVEQEDGTKTKETRVIREASEHYSLRYTEVYAVECMYLRRCIARLTARIEELEKGNKEVEK